MVRLRRRAQKLRHRLRRLPPEERPGARRLLRSAYSLEEEVLAGLVGQRGIALAVRRARALSERMGALMGKPSRHAALRPEDMLRPARPLTLTLERYTPRYPLRLRWPMQYDLYRFEVLADALYRFNTMFDEKMRRTQACLDQLGVEGDLLPDRVPLERPVDKHDGEYALPPKRRLPPQAFKPPKA